MPADEQAVKRRVTLVSVAAAVVLTALKLWVGLATGSLGLLSEAVHSGLDTVASALTFVAVRIAARPADADHPYGHGRVENLAAVMQGALLLVTAGAIGTEAVHRLAGAPAAVEPTAWAFAVLLAGIAVDVWRSRMLLRAARRFHSRALEADALNFRADLFSSTVVLGGLALTAYAHTGAPDGALWGLPRAWVLRADAAAALVVAGVIVVMSGRLMLEGVHVLTDRVSTDLRARVTGAAAAVPGVLAVRAVRVRESGHRVLADLVVTTSRTASLAEAHRVTEAVEAAVRAAEPRAEAVVHVEPESSPEETVAETIRAVALRLGMQTHHEVAYAHISPPGRAATADGPVGGRAEGRREGLEASFHLELERALPLWTAHAEAHRLVATIRAEEPRLGRVDVHLEPAEPQAGRRRDVTRERAALAGALARCVDASPVGARTNELRLYGADDPSVLDLVLHCAVDGELTVGDAHHRAERLEHALRECAAAAGHELTRVVVHTEPLS